MKPKVAISACLMGRECRYDGKENRDEELLSQLEGYTLVPFCPEEFCYGTPRPTMDLVSDGDATRAISNLTGADMSSPIEAYAEAFFDTHSDIELFIGKDRSPSCGVNSAKIYDRDKNLISTTGTGLMAEVAAKHQIESYDATSFGR